MNKILFGSNDSVLKIGDIEINCMVLTDYRHVVSHNHVVKLLGLDTKTDSSLVNFFQELNTFITIPESFINALKTPIFIEKLDENQLPIIISGYESTIIIEIGQLLISTKNNGKTPKNILKWHKIAQKISMTFETKRINTVIDEVTGFTFYKEKTKEKIKNYLIKYLNDGAFEWVVTFTDAFYEAVFKFLNISWLDLKKEHTKTADFIYSIIFLRIDDKLLLELQHTKPKRAYINQNGVLRNREHIELQRFNQSILDFLTSSQFERSEFMQLVIQNYPKNTLRQNLDFKEIETQNLTIFNENLKMGLQILK